MKNKLKLPTQEYLNSILEYKDGFLYWKISKAGVQIGRKAGFLDGRGYLAMNIENICYRQHNIIWKMIKGFDPIGDIDHINHEKTDNRIENLRDVSKSENQRNRTLNKNNTSGYNNIVIKKNNRYQVRFKQFKISKHFDNLESAILFRNEKYLEFGFHENHGK